MIDEIKSEIKKNSIKAINFNQIIILSDLKYVISLYNDENEFINYYIISENELNELFNALIKLSENALLSKIFINDFITLKNTLYL